MMHTTTSPLYAIVASNDIATAMMDGSSGRSLTQEVIEEAVDFRQVVGRLWRTFADKKDWFFKPWNVETVKNPTDRRDVAFEDAPAQLLCQSQDPWMLHPGDKWHGRQAGEERGPGGAGKRVVQPLRDSADPRHRFPSDVSVFYGHY
jgi:arginine decarboxylase